MAKVVAFRRREKVNPNQELAALGASNVAAAFSGALPVAGGFARTMVNYHAGARSQAASIVAALWVALAVWLLAPAIAVIPRCVLAAVIIVAIVQLIDVGELRAAWRYDRSDALVLLVTFAAVLAAGVEGGLLSGAVCSYATQLWRVGKPHIAVVGRVPGTEHFRNVRRHNVLVWPNLLLVRPDESLSFANVSVVEDFIMAELARQPAVRHVVLLGNAVNHIDLSALESLTQLLENLRGAQVNVHLAEIKGPVMDRLGAVGFVGKLAPGQVLFRVDDALDRLAAGEPQLIGPLGT
jgi:SulP family sulfate permease